MALDKFGIAKRIAKEITPGMYVNLGIGIPMLVAQFIPTSMNVLLQSENGLLGIGPYPKHEEVDADLINAGKETTTLVKGGVYFDSAESFGMIRAGKIDLTVLGAMEVASNGDIANWKIPGKMVKGMGGAMDLVAGARNVIVAMQHNGPGGSFKLVEYCRLPLTGKSCVKKVITDIAVIEIKHNQFCLREKAPGVSIDEIKMRTGDQLVVTGHIPDME